MIVQISFLCFISLVAGSAIYPAPIYRGPSAPIYESRPQPYALNIDAKDEYGTTILQQEQGDELGNKKGSYGYIDPYGISRQVDYVADENGFRAVIKTNEPGTESQNPADVLLQSSAAPAPYSSPSLAAPSSAYGVAPVVRQPVRQVIAAPALYGGIVSQPVAPLAKAPLY